jgi:hypothetical protein
MSLENHQNPGAAGVKAALVAANAAPFTAGRGYGCGRAYVCLTGPKDEIKRVAAACKQLGLMFLKKAYGTSGNAIYMGYDNADGKALAKSEAFANVLNVRGIKCYADAVGD